MCCGSESSSEIRQQQSRARGAGSSPGGVWHRDAGWDEERGVHPPAVPMPGIPVAGGEQGAGAGGRRRGRAPRERLCSRASRERARASGLQRFSSTSLLLCAGAEPRWSTAGWSGSLRKAGDKGRPCVWPLNCLGKQLCLSISPQGSSLTQAEAVSQAACPEHLHLCPLPATPLLGPWSPWICRLGGRIRKGSQQNGLRGVFELEK